MGSGFGGSGVFKGFWSVIVVVIMVGYGGSGAGGRRKLKNEQ